MSDPKLDVIGRLLEFARVIRRRAPADQAAAVLPYEQQLEKDFNQRKAELAVLPGLEKKAA